MNLYKLENGQPVQYNGESIKLYIANPTEEQLMFVGYKKLIESEIPEYDEETQTLEVVYEEIKDSIIKRYVVIDKESDEQFNGVEI